MKRTTLFLEVREAAPSGIERRGNLPGETLEYRAGEGGKPGTVTGYAAVWGAKATELRWFTEEIRKGAFTESLTKRDQVALAHHDWSKPLARRSVGTLTLSEDDKGLKVSIALDDTSHGRDVEKDIRNGNITGFSIGMVVQSAEWKFAQTNAEVDHRAVTKADLYEVSPVTMPAYDDTIVEMAQRSLQAAKAKAKPADETPSLATLKAEVEALDLAGVSAD